MNLDEIQKGLSVNSKQGKAAIEDMDSKTEGILEEILDNLPDDYGEKKAVDYFLSWLDEHISPASHVGEDALNFSSMDEVFEGVYIYNNLSALVKEKATALGSAKILSELCSRAGMESHIVLGVWEKNRISQEGYVFCAVEMNGQTIYVDASGEKGMDLGEQRYLTEKEAMNHMKFVEYFDYQ